MADLITSKFVLKYVDFLGSVVTEKLNIDKKSKRLLILYDFLRKIQANFLTINTVENQPIEQFNYSCKILYRTICADLMEMVFYLSLDDNELNKALDITDIKHIKSVIETINIRIELGSHIFDTNLDEIKKEREKIVNFYKEQFGNKYFTIDVANELEYASIKGGISGDKGFKGQLSQIATYLKNHRETSQYYYLYHYYKYLSQSEHYSNIGRNFIYETKGDHVLIRELNVIIFATLDYARVFLEINNDDERVIPYLSFAKLNRTR